MPKTGTVGDAPLIAATSSTKYDQGKCKAPDKNTRHNDQAPGNLVARKTLLLFLANLLLILRCN
jgi:hypothetical protein